VPKDTTSQAQERVDASPEVIYDLVTDVTDVTRMGDGAQNVSGAFGLTAPMALFPEPDLADETGTAWLGGRPNLAWSRRIGQKSSHSSPATQSAVT
jgi:hypothetical protein